MATPSSQPVKEIEMPSRMRSLILAILTMLLASGCALVTPQSGRWIRFDAATQRYSIDAQQVARGALLDELKSVARAEVRPQPDREAPVTARAQGLDLEALIALILPADAHATIRPGAREVAASGFEGGKAKQGTPVRPVDGAVPKPDAALASAQVRRTGTLKASAEAPDVPGEVSGPRAKAASATLLRTAEGTGPKQPLPGRAERATVRLVLEFVEGAPPRVIDAQLIEGRAPPQRFVVGTYLYAVTGADGRLLEAGTFQDPLVEHSYLPEGQHSVGRARTGVAGISIARENLAGTQLQVVDLSGIPLPRELDEKTVRSALERGRTLLRVETRTLLGRLEQEPRK